LTVTAVVTPRGVIYSTEASSAAAVEQGQYAVHQ
jgi:hypothetical protein